MRVAKDATSLMPIVGLASDMVATGLVRSFAHPGGNVTGVSVIAPELDGKRQDILMEAAPGTPRIAALADFNVTTSRQLELQNAARARGVELIIVAARTPEAIGPAMSDAKARGPLRSTCSRRRCFIQSPPADRARRDAALARNLRVARNGGRRRPHGLRHAS